MGDELIPTDYLLSPEQFEQIFINREHYQKIRTMAFEGHLGAIHNRYISWRIFLNILPEKASPTQWVSITSELRQEYQHFQQSFRVNPIQKVQSDDLDPLIFNPLSQASDVISNQNPWNNFFVDNDLKDQIMDDVKRTFQERPLFQLQQIQTIMSNILFTWAKQNPDLSYKQGMNQLLGTVLFVAFAQKAPLHPQISNQAARILSVLNDQSYIQADVYWIFKRLMDLGIKQLFYPILQSRPAPKKGDELFSWDADRERNDLVGQDKSKSEEASWILKRCHRVHHRFLQTLDRELYTHLERQKTEPQMYLQRWLRCMLTRQFNFADTLVLWDAIFASANVSQRADLMDRVNLLDFICVAMIGFVRAFRNLQTVLESDNTGILRRLLKFPPVEDVTILISMAISYKERLMGGNKGKTTVVRDTRNFRTMMPEQTKKPQPYKRMSPTVKEPSPSPSKPVSNPLGQSIQQNPVQSSVQQSQLGSNIIGGNPKLDPLSLHQKSLSSPNFFEPQVETSFAMKKSPNPAPRPSIKSEDPVLNKVNLAIEQVQEQLNLKSFNQLGLLRVLDNLKDIRKELTQNLAKKVADPLRRV